MISMVPMKGTGLKPKLLPYARYVYIVVHNVLLASSMQVDHIDGDRTNDVRSNLQVLTPTENRLKSQVERRNMGTQAMMICPECRGLFYRAKRLTHMAKKGEFTACSRKCAGKFRRRLQEASMLGDADATQALHDKLVGNFVRWVKNENPDGKILVAHKMQVEPWEAVSQPLPSDQM
jgi:hypothetical protein